MRMHNLGWVLSAGLLFHMGGCGADQLSTDPEQGPDEVTITSTGSPLGKGGGLFDNQNPLGGATNTAGNGITYHGGPVMLGTNTIYYIWYGNWGNGTDQPILENFAQHLGGSPYFNINTTYYDSANKHVTNSVAFGKSIKTTATLGKSLSDSQILQVVTSAISSGKLPKSASALYFVLTSKEVTASSGFCTQYCGWHNHASALGIDLKYSFVGNPARCPTSCTAQPTKSPNGNIGADGMASIIAHEFEETVTDPDLNAWWDPATGENGDKCAWKFGTEYKVSNGSNANVKIGSRDYLIQQNWVNAGGGSCSMHYP